jgi:hypothetical protein
MMRDLQILEERFVCVARREHPLAKKKALTLPYFASVVPSVLRSDTFNCYSGPVEITSDGV